MVVLSLPQAYAARAALHPGWSRSVERLLEDRAARNAAPRLPAMDVSESETAYRVTFDLPGMSKEDVSVNVERMRVSVAAAAKQDEAARADGSRLLHRERTALQYARNIGLPVEIDATTSSARFEDGVLTLTLTKRAPVGATQLRID